MVVVTHEISIALIDGGVMVVEPSRWVLHPIDIGRGGDEIEGVDGTSRLTAG